MVKLVFKPFLGAPVILGPLPSVVIVGKVIHGASATTPLAHYEPPYWIHGGLHYVAFEIDPQARVVFVGKDARKVSGPHSEMHFADGMLYAGAQSLARFDPAQLSWIDMLTQQAWPQIEIQRV